MTNTFDLYLPMKSLLQHYRQQLFIHAAAQQAGKQAAEQDRQEHFQFGVRRQLTHPHGGRAVTTTQGESG